MTETRVTEIKVAETKRPGELKLNHLFQPGQIGKFKTKNLVKYGACCVSNYNDRDGTISPSDLDDIQLTDSPDAAVESILGRGETLGLHWRRAVKPRWILGEDGQLQVGKL